MDNNFSLHKTSIDSHIATFLSLNKSGIPTHFYPANGFPSGTYRQFLSSLTSELCITSLNPRSCWPNIGKPPKQINWEVYADDLIEFLDQTQNEPIIGMGHSQGATATIIAASKRPDLFKQLVVIEPAYVSMRLSFLLQILPLFIKEKSQPLKSAILKQDIFESKTDFINSCRNNRFYKRGSDSVLHDFCEFGLRSKENGRYTLVFPKNWEASNFSKPPSIWKYLKKIEIPIILIGGKHTVFFNAKNRELWLQKSPNTSLVENLEYGHIFPLEAPEVCADLILKSI